MENRVSKEQILYLLNYLENRKELAKGQGLGVRSKDTIEKLWDDLAVKLNAFGTGASKSGFRWKRYWVDLKSKVKSKAAAVKKEFAGTGGGPNSQGLLSDIDEKVLAIIGLEAVHGDTQHRVPLFATNTSRTSTSGHESFVPKTESSEPVLDEKTGDFITTTQELQCSPSSRGKTPTPSSPQTVHIPVVTTPQRIKPHRKRFGLRAQNTGSNHWVIELEQRRVAAEEKMAEAAHIMAQAALLQAQTQKDLVELLIRKM